MSNNYPPFTAEDLKFCWLNNDYITAYFVEILNGEYSVEDARSDLRGLMGSNFDVRVKEVAK